MSRLMWRLMWAAGSVLVGWLSIWVARGFGAGAAAFLVLLWLLIVVVSVAVSIEAELLKLRRQAVDKRVQDDPKYLTRLSTGAANPRSSSADGGRP